jgi:D-tyrosyl-tRNA(Tyr) deacylase
MKLVIQRVSEAKVVIDGKVHSEIGNGLVAFLGIHKNDLPESCRQLSEKLVHLRIFPDSEVRGSITSLNPS